MKLLMDNRKKLYYLNFKLLFKITQIFRFTDLTKFMFGILILKN